MNSDTRKHLTTGKVYRCTYHVSSEDLEAFTKVSGDTNPLHVNDEFAARYGFRKRIIHGMLLGSQISRVLGTVFPGSGSMCLSQSMEYLKPVYEGEDVDIEVKVKHRSESLGVLLLETKMFNQQGVEVLTGEARVMMLDQGRASE